MIRTYKYRLKTTKKQSCILDDILFQMRTVYNDALNERKILWNKSRKSVSAYDQNKRMTQERRKNHSMMNLLNSASIQRIVIRLDKAYKEFFKGLRGIPRFKSERRFKSVEYTYGNGCKLKGDRLYIQHVGNIKIRLSSDIPEEAKIKSIIVKNNSGNWDVSFILDLPDAEIEDHTGPAIGIDVGLKSLLALSDGTLVENPRWLRASLSKLRVLQRRVSRRKRYSSGWKKAQRQVAKLHAHIANQRRDFWHKITTELANKYSLIAIEDLNLSFMTKSNNLSLSTYDASLGNLRVMLGYKVENTGTQLVTVNPYNTTQICSGCGSVVTKGLSDRIHNCGLILDRDVNAAKNILTLGLSVKALTYPIMESVALEAPSLN